MPAKLMRANKVIGTKQTHKALETGKAKVVYIARDAESKVTSSITEYCSKANVRIVYVDTMAQLGQACGIDVGAAVAGIIEN